MLLQERLEDLSCYYWLKSLFSAYPFVTVVDGFPEELLTTPTIAVDWNDLVISDYELGERSGLKERLFYFDVYAKNKSQRDEFVYLIINALKDGISVYDYNVGFPEQGVTNQPRIGHLRPVQRRANKTDIPENLVNENSDLYYRATVFFVAEYNAITGG